MAENHVDLEVIYCSTHGVSNQFDRQFNSSFKWNIPILDGYNYYFFKNYALRPSLYSFWGLMNWGIIWHLLRSPKGILVINGWQYFIYVISIIVGKVRGHTVCLRGESPLSREKNRSFLKKITRKFILEYILFKFVDVFLYIGDQNKRFYKFFGVPDEKLLFSPYSVDNDRFQKHLSVNSDEKEKIRSLLGLPKNKIIILYSGKYIAKKRPLDLLESALLLDNKKYAIIFMGEGEMRKHMEDFILKHELKDIYLTGFINQLEITNYYSASDIFVMCSDADETWGLSINEAMNSGLPIVASNEIGCTTDLVKHGYNGFVYPMGNVVELSKYLNKLMNEDHLRIAFGQQSLEIIKGYSYETIIRNLKTIDTL